MALTPHSRNCAARCKNKTYRDASRSAETRSAIAVGGAALIISCGARMAISRPWLALFDVDFGSFLAGALHYGGTPAAWSARK